MSERSGCLVGQFTVAGERLVADPAGALYWPHQRMLIVADLHLEKGAAFAARGVPLPPYDTPGTLGVVEALVARYRPVTVVALGDSFHRGDSHLHLEPASRARLAALTAGLRWIWVLGNHDPEPPAGLGGAAAEALRIGPLSLVHAPCGSRPGEIAGHLHPVARLRARGRVLRRRCFAASAERIVMPALGAYAGGLNVLDRAFDTSFPDGRFHAWMLGERRLYQLSPARLVADPAPALVRRAG